MAVDGAHRCRCSLVPNAGVRVVPSVDLDMVEELMRRLPPREQEIVRLRFYDELSQSEIAERVGISQMHVSRLLRRSFEQMRQQVESP